jgi:non-specific serine/threonine protein kinase
VTLTKAYSSKALPAGTIIREWRLEDVLGVGGFGIVYKGRGIYFGELVAIKEYFPSSISERDGEDTVVPIGSDVEEVHALGLKKFVEEAKLLWNLSTPSRHPNIVSVRSLFQIHGTAYMVMDFEDGVSLSKLLKEGRRFNERSLWNIVKPIAEGLDRAHRVGVLHRDIKPPNILITEDNRPVLIDFGSARFEAAEATSTSVTFHTPPYAAVEQYVKTYDQGPWTDVYALAVVLYECVTGEKPPEVLERLHGGMGKPLADDRWPGFSKKFLQAIDTGMTIKPSERPQSIHEWLAMFPNKDSTDLVGADDEATRFFAHEVAAGEIVPIATSEVGVDAKEHLETQVPSDPRDAEFKRAGQETITKKRKKSADEAEAVAAKKEADEPPPPIAEKAEARNADQKKPAALVGEKKDGTAPWYKEPRMAMLAGAGAVILLGGIGFMAIGGGKSGNDGGYDIIPALTDTSTPITLADAETIATDQGALVAEAQTAGAPATAINDLVKANEQIGQQLTALRPLLGNPANADAAKTKGDELRRTATTANVTFANALLQDAEARALRVPTQAAAANPNVAKLQATLTDLRTSVQNSANATDPAQSIAAARDALAKSQAFAAALPAASRVEIASKKTPEATVALPRQTAVTAAPTATAPVATATTAATAPSVAPAASSSKKAQIQSIVSSGRGMARQVISWGKASGASAQAKSNAQLAKGYDSYLAKVADSTRGARTDRELDQLIKEANQTKNYISFLYKQSSQSR